MKNKLILIIGMLCLNLFNGRADEIKVNSKMTDVTVYRNAAKENRTAEALVPKGNSEVVISNITTAMIDNSLQVSVKGNATLLSVSVRTNYFNEQKNELQNPKAQRLRDSIKVIETNLRWMTEQKSLWNGELNLVTELLKQNGGKEGLKVGDINAMIDMYRARFGDLKKKLFDLSLKEEEWLAIKTKHQNQLSEMGNQKKEPVKEIVLHFSSETGGSLQLKTGYLVSQASWQPMYDIMVENTNQPVDLTYKAKLKQNTGFDWKDLKITISTANPTSNNNRPIMSPKYIDYVVYKVRSSSYEGATNMMQVDKYSLRKDETSNNELSVQVNESDIQVEYQIDARQSIPSDGKEHVCRIQNFKIPATYRYHTVPKLEQSAFLLARITNYGQYNLLSGQANVFFGETFVGQVLLNPDITADTMLVSLGRDERIVVKRTRVQDKISRKLFSGFQKDTYAYETVIRNNKGFPIEIEVLDQIPLTRRKEIEVELLDKDGACYNETYGKLLWNFTVKPNESKKVKLSYSVKYPEGKQVSEQ
jgi:uncharacterized protein (TIGR02231 family)